MSLRKSVDIKTRVVAANKTILMELQPNGFIFGFR